MLSQGQWEKINDISRGIYAPGNSYSLRTTFLQSLRELVDFDFSDFNIGMVKDGAYPYLVDPVVVSKFSKKFEENFIYQYESTFAPMDYVNWIFLSGESMTYRESDLINSDVRKKSPFFQQYLKVFDLVYVSGLVIACEGEFVGAVTLYRREKSGNFSDQDMYILKQLLPHLQNRFDIEKDVLDKNKKTLSYQLKNQYGLTNREAEIMGYVYEGIKNEDIAKELNIAPNTVKKHIYNLFDKMGVCNRVQLIRFIYDHGLQDLWKRYV